MTETDKQIPGNGDYPAEINLALIGDPIQKLEQGKKAAAALMTVAKPILIDGKQYLRFEDWQTIGAFFGTIVGTSDPEYVEINGISGYKASAVVRRISDGMIISTASAYCLREGNWKTRENFALASMAQSRAGAKVLRNSFAWVALLSDCYEATPAEEMIDTNQGDSANSEPMASVKQLEYMLDLAITEYGDDGNHRLETHCVVLYRKKKQELSRGEASDIIDWFRAGKELVLE